MKKVFLLALVLVMIPFVNATLYDDLKSYYSFQETSGPKNDSLDRFDMTLTGGTLTTTNGLFGNAYRGDNSNFAHWGKSFDGMKNITLSFWINYTNIYEGVNREYIFGSNGTGDYDLALNDCPQGDQGFCLTINTTSGLATNNKTILNNSQWRHIVYTIDLVRQNVSMYVNGNLSANGWSNLSFLNRTNVFASNTARNQNLSSNATLDEFGIWNRTLSYAEIVQLYNNGTGRDFDYILGSYNDTQVDLLSPNNGFTTPQSTINFEVNAQSPSVGGNLTNSTLYIWFTNSTLVTTQLNLTNTNQLTNINFTVNNLIIGNYLWNVLGCSANATFYTCDYATNNRSFQRTSVTFNNTFFNVTTYETSNELFLLNVSADNSVISLTPFLVYNGSSYGASHSCNASGFCQISRRIDIPLIHTANANHTFYWDIRTFDGTGYSQANSSLFNQTVDRIILSSCTTVANMSLNFTAYDEQNLTRIKPYQFAGSFFAWLGTGTTYRNFSFSGSSIDQQTICITPSSYTFKVNADIAYNNLSEAGYNTRNYYLRNATITNNAQEIFLYLLRSIDSTSFILEVTDENLVPYNDTLVYVQRYYHSNNTFNTVQIALTDNNGKSVGFFEAETVEYKFLLVRYGQLLLQTEKRKVFPETSPFTLTFRIGASTGGLFNQYSNLSNLVYSITYNETTKMVDYTYIDTSGTTQFGRLLVQSVNPSGSAVTICNVNTTQASATILCNVTGYNGSIIARGYISRSPEQLVSIINVIISTATTIFGKSGLLLGLLIIMSVALITLYNPIVQIIAVNVTILALSMIGIITFSPIFIFGFMAVSTLIIILLRQ